MLAAYQNWIEAKIPKYCRGLCFDATEQMIEAFPELFRVRGWCNGEEHW